MSQWYTSTVPTGHIVPMGHRPSKTATARSPQSFCVRVVRSLPRRSNVEGLRGKGRGFAVCLVSRGKAEALRLAARLPLRLALMKERESATRRRATDRPPASATLKSSPKKEEELSPPRFSAGVAPRLRARCCSKLFCVCLRFTLDSHS